MAFGNKDILGIAIDDDSLVICQLHLAGDRSQRGKIVRHATLPFAEGCSLDRPEALGDALLQCLRDNKIDARRVAFGLPAGALMVKAKALPPADDAAALEMVALAAEREFAIDRRDLVCDCVLDRNEGGGRDVLLVAALKKRIDAINTIAARAKLKVVSITSSLMALSLMGAKDGSPGGRQMMLRVTPAHVELAVRDDRRVTVMKRLATRGPFAGSHPEDAGESAGASTTRAAGANGRDVDCAKWAGALSSELRRIIATLPGADGDGQPDAMDVWDGAGVADECLSALNDRLQLVAMPRSGLSTLGVTANGAAGVNAYAPAAAVALAADDRTDHLVNFLDPRLGRTERAATPARNRLMLIGGVAIVIALGVAAFIGYRLSAIASLEAQMAQIAAPADAAGKLQEKVRFARTFYDQRPDHTQTLVKLFEAFPLRESAWATNITIREDGVIIVSGRAVNQEEVLDIVQTLRDSPQFENVTQPFARVADQRSGEYAFSISFTFKPGAKQ